MRDGPAFWSASNRSVTRASRPRGCPTPRESPTPGCKSSAPPSGRRCVGRPQQRDVHRFEGAVVGGAVAVRRVPAADVRRSEVCRVWYDGVRVTCVVWHHVRVRACARRRDRVRRALRLRLRSPARSSAPVTRRRTRTAACTRVGAAATFSSGRAARRPSAATAGPGGRGRCGRRGRRAAAATARASSRRHSTAGRTRRIRRRICRGRCSWRDTTSARSALARRPAEARVARSAQGADAALGAALRTVANRRADAGARCGAAPSHLTRSRCSSARRGGAGRPIAPVAGGSV